jgi:hypothetical protein
MAAGVLCGMGEGKVCRGVKDGGRGRKLKHEVQGLCREARDGRCSDKCGEVAVLDGTHGQLLYKKIGELHPKGNKIPRTLGSGRGRFFCGKGTGLLEDGRSMWKSCTGIRAGRLAGMGWMIWWMGGGAMEEVEVVIGGLPEVRACGEDNICAELLQSMGEKGMEVMSSLINKIYKSGYMPEDFRKSIFVPIPKINRA